MYISHCQGSLYIIHIKYCSMSKQPFKFTFLLPKPNWMILSLAVCTSTVVDMSYQINTRDQMTCHRGAIGTFSLPFLSSDLDFKKIIKKKKKKPTH